MTGETRALVFCLITWGICFPTFDTVQDDRSNIFKSSFRTKHLYLAPRLANNKLYVSWEEAFPWNPLWKEDVLAYSFVFCLRVVGGIFVSACVWDTTALCLYARVSASLVCWFFICRVGKKSVPTRLLFFFSLIRLLVREREICLVQLCAAVTPVNCHLCVVLCFMHIHIFLRFQDIEHKQTENSIHTSPLFSLLLLLSVLNLSFCSKMLLWILLRTEKDLLIFQERKQMLGSEWKLENNSALQYSFIMASIAVAYCLSRDPQ